MGEDFDEIFQGVHTMKYFRGVKRLSKSETVTKTLLYTSNSYSVIAIVTLHSGVKAH